MGTFFKFFRIKLISVLILMLFSIPCFAQWQDSENSFREAESKTQSVVSESSQDDMVVPNENGNPDDLAPINMYYWILFSIGVLLIFRVRFNNEVNKIS